MLIPFLLTLISVVLYVLSFPPFSFSSCAWIALAPFLVAVSRASIRVAAGCGVLLAIGIAYGAAWWLPGMITGYLKVSPWIGWASFFAVSIGLAGVYCAVFAMWLSWLTRMWAINPVLVAAGWGVCEFARANLLIGNPWVLLGYSQVSHLCLTQIADATGPYGLGMLLAAVSACLAGLFTPVLRGQRPGASYALVGIMFGVTVAYGYWRLAQNFTTGEPIRVAVVQPAIERQFRWNRDHWRDNLERYLTLTRTATDVNLIFWPEHSVDFFLQKNSHYRDAVLHVTQEKEADLILGGQHYSYGGTTPYFHNSVFLIQQGRIAGRYDKHLLVPFAEVNPFQRLLPSLPSKYEAGRHPRLLPANTARVGAFLCFEAMYPDLVRQVAVRGAQVLANPSNDDWFGYAAPAQHQLDIASLRAIENRRYLVRATATGFSAVIDPYGRVVARSGFGSAEVLSATIQPSQTQTPYQRWGDALSWSAIAGVLGITLSRINWFTLKQIFRRRSNS